MSQKAHPRLMVALCAIGLLSTVGPFGCQRVESAPKNSSAKKSAKSIDKTAEKALRDASKYYAGLKTYTGTLNSVLSFEGPVNKKDIAAEYQFAFQKPNKLSIVLTAKKGGTVVSNGTNAQYFYKPFDAYTVKKAPATFKEAFTTPEFRMVTADILALSMLEDCVSEDPFDGITRGARSVTYVGKESVDGVSCHHLKMLEHPFNRDLWIGAGETPSINKIKIDVSSGLDGEERVKGEKLAMVFKYSNTKLDGAVTSTQFDSNHPASAFKISGFFDDARDALIGQKAPDVTLHLTDGSAVKLASFKGRPVILDFWATWCMPCLASLPIFSRISEDLKPKGLVFIGVCHEESPEKVKMFVDKFKVKSAIANEPDEKLVGLFHSNSIPESVYIDRDGVIRQVHVGLSHDFQTDFKDDAERLIRNEKFKTDAPH